MSALRMERPVGALFVSKGKSDGTKKRLVTAGKSAKIFKSKRNS